MPIQRLIGPASILAAIAVSAIVLAADWPVFGLPADLADTPGDRLAVAMRWMLAPALALMMGLAGAHSQRMFNPKAHDGQREGAGRFLEIVLRYNINTLEQGFLALVAWCGFALMAPMEQLALIPRLAVLFAVGRALFFWGYLWTPKARLFGMGLTAYSTYWVLAWLAWRAIRPG